jgi:hypothetical protein
MTEAEQASMVAARSRLRTFFIREDSLSWLQNAAARGHDVLIRKYSYE